MTFIISGCAREPQIGALTPGFEVLGKIGVRDAQRGYSARFSWRQYEAEYVIEVWGPLGQGRTRLTGTDAHMQVWRGGEMLAQGPVEEVMQAHLGWSMPVAVLPYWLSGKPDEVLTFSAVGQDEQARYTEFEQAGWQVALDRYADESALNPGRIVARSGARKVTVIVREFLQ